MTNIRVRSKTTPTADDPAWGSSNLDPNMLLVTLASAETGNYVVTVTPEDTSLSAIATTYAGTGGDEPTAATGIAAALNTAASVAGAALRNYLRPVSSASSAVLAIAVEPNAPAHRITFTPPGSATMTPDHTGALPVVAEGGGKGALSIVPVAVTSAGVPLAPGSGSVDLELVEVIDRTRPRGRKGHEVAAAVASTAVIDSIDNHPLGEPWIVSAPEGRYAVRISGDTSLPGSTNAIEIWASNIDSPVPAPAVTVSTGGVVEEYTLDIDFSDLGSGASDLINATGFPLQTRILDAWLSVRVAAAGEADLACIIGVTADPDGYKTTQNLNAVASGTLLAAQGALASGLYYADAETSGLGVTFTATALEDVSAGAWTLHVRHTPLAA